MRRYLCDFCERVIHNETQRITIKLKKRQIKMYDPRVNESYYGITRRKMDICADCYENMVKYVRNIIEDK